MRNFLSLFTYAYIDNIFRCSYISREFIDKPAAFLFCTIRFSSSPALVQKSSSLICGMMRVRVR